MSFLGNKARSASLVVLRRRAQLQYSSSAAAFAPLIVGHGHLPNLGKPANLAYTSNTWNTSNSRNFSVKNRQRKEEKRRKRQEQKAQKKEEKAASGPVVTQTKGANTVKSPEAIIAEQDGFQVAAAPPGEDDEGFVSKFSMPDNQVEKKLQQMSAQVNQLYSNGRYQMGLQIAKETREATEDHFGFSHPATASSYLNIGLCQKQLGKFHLAQASYEKALQAYDETVGTDHESYAMVLHNIGLLYQAQLHLDEHLQLQERLRLVEKALETLEAAFAIRSDELPTDHPHLIATQTALGMVLTSHILQQHKRVVSSDKKGGKFQNAAEFRSLLPAQVTEQSWAVAEGHLRDALQKAIQNPRGESARKRTDKHHYLNLQKKQALKEKFHKDKDDTTPTTTEIPPQTATAATASQNLAVFLKAKSTTVHRLQAKEWIQEANLLYQTALEIRTALLPKGHPDIYATQHSLAELYDFAGQDDEAETLRETILDSYYTKDDDESKKKEEKKKTGKQGA